MSLSPVDAFREAPRVRALAQTLARRVQPGRTYRLMEFCGGHTHAIAHHGLPDLLPPAIELIHGPGCPVCVLPVARLEQALHAARLPGVILATYADLMRVPGVRGLTLMRARAEGADVRMVASPLDVLSLARAHPERVVIFMAIGFETTAPATALMLQAARTQGLANLRVLCNHVLTPAALGAILADDGGARPDGILGPAHVATVIGAQAFRPFAEDAPAGRGVPITIAGFEPVDMLLAIDRLIERLNAGEVAVDNACPRVVAEAGNPKAREALAQVFCRRETFDWRGFGAVPHSALRLAPDWAAFDAEACFDLPDPVAPDPPGCACADIVRGRRRPGQCPLFGRLCTPDTPQGACMVSTEGACAAHWTHGRFRDLPAFGAPA
ncbi:hydrogenase formation protein HypD [Pararhodospirillum photometricum]|nr:hydrogenase formation protein HypD [Pararhodospirillum photometricum]